MPTVMIVPEAMRSQTDESYVDLLKKAGFEIRYPKNPQLARGHGGVAEVISELQGIHATLAGGEPYTEEVFAALPDLRVVARCGVGYDQVSIPAATSHKVAVTITPTSNHEAVAEVAIGLLFAVAKSFVLHHRRVLEGEWPRKLLVPLRGRTFGLLGLGRIGRSTAIRAKALGMKVIATETYPVESFVQEHQIELVSFDDLLARSDFLSIHCPWTPETEGLFNKDVFARMKPESILINTARGKLVVEEDLHAALTSGPLFGAGLDVLAQEPPDPQNPLLHLDNVAISPHLAGTDLDSLVGMGVEAASCIAKLHQGEWPAGAVVNDELHADWKW